MFGSTRIWIADGVVKGKTILEKPSPTDPMPLHSTSDFQRSREQDWKELEAYCVRFEKVGWRKMPAKDLEQFGTLYRRTAAHLAQVRNRPKEKRLEASLNLLVSRAHGHLYRPKSNGVWKQLREYFSFGFPNTIASYPRHILLSAMALLIGFQVAWFAVDRNPDLFYATVPIEEFRSPGASAEGLHESLMEGRETSTGTRTAFFGYLWQHNTRVAMLAFALGILAGVPTLFLILYNGMMLGAMTSVFHNAGLAKVWWAWIAGHGVTELSAIVFAGAAGFVLGEAVLRPGGRSRSQALVTVAKPALAMAGGTAMMLFFAALLEAFFRQSSASTATRFTVAAATAIFWGLYFLVLPRLAASKAKANSKV
jgi:uncharacterized membrane protein SpoIIM required for sporulation